MAAVEGSRFRLVRKRKVRTAQSGKSFSVLTVHTVNVKEGYCGLYAAGRKVQQKKNRRDLPGKGEKAGQEPAGCIAKAASHRQTPSAARPNRGRVVARSVTSPGFWSHRQMIAACLKKQEQNPAYISRCR